MSGGPHRIVVLGATGFAGRHLSRAFEAAGADVLRVGRSAHGPGARPLDLAGVRPAALAALVREHRAAVVVNAAGAVWESTEDQMRALNAGLPAALAAACALLPPHERPRLVHLGSVYEYGTHPDGTTVTEDLTPRPDGAYGRTKLAGTRALLDAAASGGAATVVLRVSNMVGPGCPPAGLPGRVALHLARAAREVRRGRPAPPLRLTPLHAHRDFVDVRDVADAAVAAASPGRVGGRIYSVGRGTCVPVRDLVRALLALSPVPVDLVEEGTAAAPRGDVGRLRLDIGAAAADLGWRPARPLQVSLRDLLAEACGPLGGRPTHRPTASTPPSGVQDRSSRPEHDPS